MPKRVFQEQLPFDQTEQRLLHAKQPNWIMGDSKVEKSLGGGAGGDLTLRHKLHLKPRTSVLRGQIASTHLSWSASPNQSLEVQAWIKYPDAHSVCSIFEVHIFACSGPQELPKYSSRQLSRQKNCCVMADDSSEIPDSSPSSYSLL